MLGRRRHDYSGLPQPNRTESNRIGSCSHSLRIKIELTTLDSSLTYASMNCPCSVQIVQLYRSAIQMKQLTHCLWGQTSSPNDTVSDGCDSNFTWKKTTPASMDKCKYELFPKIPTARIGFEIRTPLLVMDGMKYIAFCHANLYELIQQHPTCHQTTRSKSHSFNWKILNVGSHYAQQRADGRRHISRILNPSHCILWRWWTLLHESYAGGKEPPQMGQKPFENTPSLTITRQAVYSYPWRLESIDEKNHRFQAHSKCAAMEWTYPSPLVVSCSDGNTGTYYRRHPEDVGNSGTA